MRFKTLSTLLGIIAFLGIVACDDTGGPPGPGAHTDLHRMEAALTAFQTCDELSGYLHDLLVDEFEHMAGLYEECMRDDTCYGFGGSWRGDVGMPEPGLGVPEDSVGEPAPAPPPSASDPGDPSDAPRVPSDEPRSDTNVQEQGVDEADIVKADGEYLYILSGSWLRIVRSTPVEEMALLGSAELPGTPLAMFLAGDRLAVFSSLYRYDGGGGRAPHPDPGWDNGGAEPGGRPTAPPDASAPDPGAEGGFEDAEHPDMDPPDGAAKRYAGASGELPEAVRELSGQLLAVTLFDISDRSDPRVVRQTWLEGGYVSSRMVGTRMHVVVSGRPALPEFDWYRFVDYGYDDWNDGAEPGGRPPAPPDAVEPAPMPAPDAWEGSDGDGEDSEFDRRAQPLRVDIAGARAAYMSALSKIDFDRALPRRVDIIDDEIVSERLVPCETFYHPSVTMGLDILAVATIDLDQDGFDYAATGILGSSDTVYASAETLYVATYLYHYWRWADSALANPDDTVELTAVHAFGVEGLPTYQASGFVTGRVLNQFSMSEYDGYLRIATTVRDWWGFRRGDPGVIDRDMAVGTADNSDTGGARPDSATDNLVTVLRRDGDRLVEEGRLAGLGKPNESIFAARFFGPVGYVVTFEQIDPLYVIDLSEPTNPVRRGELEVPGYSSYIHPLGDDHLLTIGRGSSDPASPGWLDSVKLSIYDVSDMDDPTEVAELLLPSMHSEAEYDHKAFTYFAHLGLLAIPLQSYWWRGYGEEPPNGLALFEIDPARGIEMVGTISHSALSSEVDDPYCYYLPAVRRGVFIGERIYSISDLGVLANEASDGLAPLGGVAFPGGDYWYGDYYCGGYHGDVPDEGREP